jgi:hypothetical protein
MDLRVRTPSTNSNVGKVKSVVLKQGPQSRKEAALFEIFDKKTGEYHHDALKITAYNKKQKEWLADEKRTINLDGEEIDKLTSFLHARRSELLPSADGSYLVLPSRRDLTKFIAAVDTFDVGETADILAVLLQNARENPAVLSQLVSKLESNGSRLDNLVSGLNLALYEKVGKNLGELIKNSSREADFQSLLKKNPWVFGSEYSELLSRRSWTRDEQNDFVSRRTVDGGLEVIEIKTPLEGRNLFNRDQSHDNLFPGKDLSLAIAQVEKYLEKLDSSRNTIKAEDHIDFHKVSAKIIIGRDGDAAQKAALRRHNSHLNRIEIITFDGLLAIAQKVLGYLRDPAVASTPVTNVTSELNENMPF